MRLVGLILVIALTGSGEWKKIIDKDGVVVMQRPSQKSAFDDFRLTTTTPLSPKAIEAVLWDHTAYPKTNPYVRALKVLSRAPDEVYAHLEIAMPVLQDRDYCMRYFRHTDDKGVVTLNSHIDDS